MGSMAVAGAIIAAGAVAGSAISSAGASSVNSSSQNFAAAQNQQAMDFSERMHNQTVQEGIQAENRADKRYIEQSQFNQGLQKEMLQYVFDNFNSPAAQAKALRAAGFNPSTLLGNSSSPFGNVSAPASTGTSYNLGSTPAAPVGSVVGSPSLLNPLAPFGDSVKSITSSLGDLARANLDTSSSNRTEKLLELEVREKLLSNKNAEVALSHNKLLLGIDRAFKSKKEAAELKHLVNSASLLALQGKTEEANHDVLKLQKKLFEFQDRKNEADIPYLVQNAKAYADGLLKANELTEEKKKTEHAIQASNYAGAAESRAGAALKISQKQEQDYNNRIAKINAENSEIARKDMLNALLTDLHKQAAQNNQQNLAAQIQFFRDSLNDPRFKSENRQRLDVSLDWLRQKFGFGVSSNISIK